MRALALLALVGLLAPISANAAPYQLTAGAGVVRESDGAAIPADARNADWQAYQAWFVGGGTPDPAPTPSAAQQAQTKYNAAIAAGVALTSTGSSALNGSYAIDTASQQKIASVALYIAVN